MAPCAPVGAQRLHRTGRQVQALPGLRPPSGLQGEGSSLSLIEPVTSSVAASRSTSFQRRPSSSWMEAGRRPTTRTLGRVVWTALSRATACSTVSARFSGGGAVFGFRSIWPRSSAASPPHGHLEGLAEHRPDASHTAPCLAFPGQLRQEAWTFRAEARPGGTYPASR